MQNIDLTAFLEDCPYVPEAVLFDEILEVDAGAGLVRARMPTRADLPLTRDQRAHEVRHPRHVSGGLMVHVTGMLGFAHAYFVLGLRHADGWIGFGTHIHEARWPNLARIGPPLLLECRATRVRRLKSSIFTRYAFLFTQDGRPVYEGDQTAAWSQVAGP